MNAATVDCLIVGQGLAGSTLAWRLVDRGWSVLVVDRDEPETSSKVAAGLVTPITGRSMAASWRIGETLPQAIRFYRDIEQRCGRRFFFERETVRVFRSAAEAAGWEERVARDPEVLRWVVERRVTPGHASPWVRSPWGAFVMRGGYLDVPGFLDATRGMLRERGGFRADEFREDELIVEDGRVRWRGVEAQRLVLCQGHEGAASRFFDWVPFRSAKGEILDLEFDDPPAGGDQRILNGGAWLVPLEGGGFRAGSTYSWHALDSIPTAVGRLDIEERLRRFLLPGFRVTGHRAAVRPIINASRVLVGTHPAREPVAFFNGLGSKGSMNAPFFADVLAGHLVDGVPLDEAIDLRRNF